MREYSGGDVLYTDRGVDNSDMLDGWMVDTSFSKLLRWYS